MTIDLSFASTETKFIKPKTKTQNNQVVYWNLFDLTPYKGLWVVVYLLNGHLSKGLAPKMDYQYQAYFCFLSKFSLNMAILVFQNK